MTQHDIDTLTKIAATEPAKQVALEPIPDDLFDDEADSSTSVPTYFEDVTPPPVADKRAKPFMTIAVVSGGVLMMFALIGRGCSSKDVESIASKTPQAPDQKAIAQKDAQIEALQRKIDDINAIKAVKAKPKTNPVKPKTQAIARSVPASYSSAPSESYAPVVSASRVPAPQPVAYTPKPSPQSAPRDTRELDALRAQIRQLQQPKVAEVAQVEPVQSLPVENVSMQENATIAQVDGGLEEQAILSDSRIAEVPIGTEARAVLDTPITGDQSQVMLSLKSDVLDNAGKVLLAANTKLLGTATVQGGVVQIQPQVAIVNGSKVPFPAQSVMVLKADRSPLIAKKFNGGNGLGRAVLGALLDGGSAIASNLTQARSTSSFSSANGTFNSTTNANPTLGSALIAGGGAITQSIGGTLKQTLTQPQNESTPILGVKAGIELSLVFGAPVQMLTASATLPEPTPAPQAEPTAYTQEQQILSSPENIQLTPDMIIQ